MSAESLYHLVYQSRATALPSEADLQEILRQSRAWNTDHRITGVLLYSAGHFMQVLEGPAHEVQYIFARINQDLRHHDVTRLADGPLARRSFADWSMGFLAIEADAYRHLTGFRRPGSPEYTAALAATGDEDLHELLTHFVHDEVSRV